MTGTENMAPRERLLELETELYRIGRNELPLTVRKKMAAEAGGARIPAIFAMGRHSVETAHAAVELIAAGRDLVAMPLVRSAYESALTAQWLFHSDLAIGAFLREDVRHRRLLSERMARSAFESVRNSARRFAHTESSYIDELLAAPEGGNIEQRCQAFEGGLDLYNYYRLMCSLVHPGATLADFYCEISDESPLGLALKTEPSSLDTDGWIYFCIVSGVWALRALDHLDQNRRDRGQLRRIARELGFSQTLKLTPEAERKIFTMKRDARRAAWRPPRSRSREAPGDIP